MEGEGLRVEGRGIQGLGIGPGASRVWSLVPGQTVFVPFLWSPAPHLRLDTLDAHLAPPLDKLILTLILILMLAWRHRWIS